MNTMNNHVLGGIIGSGSIASLGKRAGYVARARTIRQHAEAVPGVLDTAIFIPIPVTGALAAGYVHPAEWPNVQEMARAERLYHVHGHRGEDQPAALGSK